MQGQFICLCCGQILGTIVKEEITEQDQQEYAASMQCSLGTPNEVVIDIQEE